MTEEMEATLSAEQHEDISLNNEDTDTFIELYEEFPILWDTDHPQHCVKGDRLEALRDLALLMDKHWTVDQVERKINSLRESYNKEKIRQKRQGLRKHRPWPHYERLRRFLSTTETNHRKVKPPDSPSPSQSSSGPYQAANGSYYYQSVAASHTNQTELQLMPQLIHQVIKAEYPAATHLETYSSPKMEPAEEENETSSTLGDVRVEVNWSHAAVLLLIESWCQHKVAFDNPALKKTQVWARIAEIMQSKGHQFTRDQCDKKWRALKGRYKSIACSSKGSGNGRRRWEFFPYMEEALADDPSIHPVTAVSSAYGALQNDESVPEEFSGASQAASPAPCTSSRDSQVEALTPSRKRKCHDGEPSSWMEKWTDDYLKELREIKEIMRERNEILRIICDKL